MTYYTEKDLALCGLACVLCSNQECPGCKARGCKEASSCSVYNCVNGKGLDGCYQCGEFPCGEDMLKGIRNRAFNRYAIKWGKDALLKRLRINYENGITYHKADGLKGDYDLLEYEEDIMRLIRFGSHNPYTKCPKFETENFVLRLVGMDDAKDLLKCYSDAQAQEFFNADKCTSDFRYKTLEEMESCIGFWLDAYVQEAFVRFAIVDKELNLAVGTIEMFGMVGQFKTPHGILRLDICSEYEKSTFLTELFMLCINEFFILFGVEKIITKAIPSALNKIESLTGLGFVPYESAEHQYCWSLDRE